MPHCNVAFVIALASLVLSACGRHEPPEIARRSPAAAGVSAPQDTTFAGTMAPVQRPPSHPGATPRILRSDDVASAPGYDRVVRSEEHTSELQSLAYLVCRLLL